MEFTLRSMWNKTQKHFVRHIIFLSNDLIKPYNTEIKRSILEMAKKELFENRLMILTLYNNLVTISFYDYNFDPFCSSKGYTIDHRLFVMVID